MRLALSETLKVRHGKLREAIRSAQLDALVVTHLPNLLYLTNFSGTAGIAVVTGDRIYLIVDFRYAAAVKALFESPNGCPDSEIVPLERTYDETLAALIGKLQPGRLGIEGAHLSIARCRQLARRMNATIEDADAGAEREAPGATRRWW